MPVNNDHLSKTVQVWNGIEFSMMDKQEAEKKQAEGLLQITTNMQSRQLKTKDQFRPKAPKKDPEKSTYINRMMKAE